MKMYNAETDTLIRDIKAHYKGGFVVHYNATNADTGKRVKVSKDEMRGFQNTKHVDYKYIRGMDGDMDEFMRDTF